MKKFMFAVAIVFSSAATAEQTCSASEESDSPKFYIFNVADSTLKKLNTAINISTE